MILASLPRAGFCMIPMDRKIDGQYLSQAEHTHGIDFKLCIEIKLLTLHTDKGLNLYHLGYNSLSLLYLYPFYP